MKFVSVSQAAITVGQLVVELFVLDTLKMLIGALLYGSMVIVQARLYQLHLLRMHVHVLTA
jgi:hypothetical protein